MKINEAKSLKKGQKLWVKEDTPGLLKKGLYIFDEYITLNDRRIIIDIRCEESPRVKTTINILDREIYKTIKVD